MEDKHSPAASIIMSKLLMIDAVRHVFRKFQPDTSGPFLQVRTRSIVFIALPTVYGEVFPEFKEYCYKSVLLENCVLNDNVRQLLILWRIQGMVSLYGSHNNLSHMPCCVQQKRRRGHTPRVYCLH
jgi:hypothetical protein